MSKSDLCSGQHQDAWHDGPFWYHHSMEGSDCFFDCGHFDCACNLCDHGGMLDILWKPTTKEYGIPTQVHHCYLDYAFLAHNVCFLAHIKWGK